MPALMAAAAWSDDSDGECGDGWFSLAVIVLSGTCRRVGDGGSELRSGAIVVFLSERLPDCLWLIDRFQVAAQLLCPTVTPHHMSVSSPQKSLHCPDLHAFRNYCIF
jgi:hypothetical protein